MNDISQKIKRIRGELSQTEFAQRVSIHHSLISQYESGRKFPSLASLIKLAEYGNVSIEYLLGIDEPIHQLTAEENSLIYLWRRIPPKEKSRIANSLERLAE